jgi:hypothetical protein
MEWTEFEQWASPGRHTEDVITLCGGVVAANAVRTCDCAECWDDAGTRPFAVAFARARVARYHV